MAQGVSKESPNHRNHSGKGKEERAKHTRKERLTGVGNLKKIKDEENLVLSDQGSSSEEGGEATVQRTALLPTPTSGLGRLHPVKAMGPPDSMSRSKKWVV